MLANRNIGTNAIEIRKRTKLSAANALLAKMRSCISGDSVPSSTRMKTPIRISPMTMEPEDEQPEPERGEDGALVVERGRPARVVRLRAQGQDHRRDRDRNVDPEDRPPGQLDQEAAGERADRG